MTIRRHVKRAILFLIIGVVVNIAVAWWLGWRVLFNADSFQEASKPFASGPETVKFLDVMEGPAGLMIIRHHQFGADDLFVRHLPSTLYRRNRSGPSFESMWPRWGWLSSRTPQEFYDGSVESFNQVARGGPMLSMWCEIGHGTGERVRGGALLGYAYRPDGPSINERVLPFRPIWLGFTVDSMAYAVAMWTMALLLIAARRRRRKQRGLCPACAYPVGVSTICTECGQPVTPHAPARNNERETSSGCS